MQCHVEGLNLDLPASPVPVSNGFVGERAPLAGARAGAGAPPVIPHTTMMRTRCLSCHGPSGQPGLGIDHPERLNCVQCHAAASSLDQTSPFFSGRATLLVWPAPDADPEGPVDRRP
jgi:cytochrome c-type protein NapB